VAADLVVGGWQLAGAAELPGRDLVAVNPDGVASRPDERYNTPPTDIPRLVVTMPYRPFFLATRSGPEPFWVRVPDEAVIEWLAERAHLRARGYPDRPPDVDTPALRAWLPRLGEGALPYFQRDALPDVAQEALFGVFSATWHSAGGSTTKVLVTGGPDGAFVSRVVITAASGKATVDKAHLFPASDDPDQVWRDIETVLAVINAGPGWEPGDPRVTTYEDYVTLDAELIEAKADAVAAGLLASELVH
jgi:hypothetical protein